MFYLTSLMERDAVNPYRNLLAQSALKLPFAVVLYSCVFLTEQAATQTIDGGQVVSVPGTHTSPWSFTGSLSVGNLSNGTLNIGAGGVVSSGSGFIGRQAAAVGLITVSGAGAQLTSGPGLSVGNFGNGTLEISSGGRVTSTTNSYIAVSAGSIGAATVSGAGSQWNTTGFLRVGNTGVGTLNVTEGAVVSNGLGYIGYDTGANGSVSVSGIGSVWTNTSNLSVGSSGTGALDITNGGAVSSVAGFIGSTASAHGTVLVDGGGSSWTSTGLLTVGAFGNGSLTVSNNGTVSAANMSVSANSGSHGVINIGAASTDLVAAPGRILLTDPSPVLALGTGGSVVFNHTDNSGSFEFTPFITDAGKVSVYSGATAFTADNNYSGGTVISSGTLQLGNGGTTGSIIGNVTNNGSLNFDRSNLLTFVGIISGTGAVNQIGSGTTVLTSTNTYSGGTTISSGTLQLGNGSTTGIVAGDVMNNGVLAFDRSDTLAFSGNISGTGNLNQIGSGNIVLTNSNSYTGSTTVANGGVYIDGNQTAATGTTSVLSGATLGGSGTIGGDVIIADGATLSPGKLSAAPGALTINGDLALSGGSTLEYSFGQANIPGGALNDLTVVHGDLVLDGTINVVTSPGGAFDPGIYRVISYDGSLTNNLLEIGTIPTPSYYVQTSIANQVNLVNTNGLLLNFWDGAAGPNNNGVVNGGDGFWQNHLGNDNWTTSTGTPNAPWSTDAFAIFQATPGTVTIDNSLGTVSASGMQFAVDGYVITGRPLTLVEDSLGSGRSIIRVGDGTAAGTGMAATINSVLNGNTQVTKTDLGTLILQGNNSYSGGTAINGGALQVASNANLGDVTGGMSFNGGTLRTTADFTIDRATVLEAGGGTIETVGATTLGYDGVMNGDGGLTKIGTGTLVLNGTNTYAGGTAINGGTVQISSDANLGAASGPLGIDGGTLHSTGNIAMNRVTTIGAGNATIETDAGTTLTQQGNIAGAGALTKTGDGAFFLTDTGTYTGGTTIASGLLQLGDGGTSGSIVGDVSNNGTLAFNRSDALVFDGVISGTGNVRQIGSGVTVLNKQSAYSGATSVEAGSLAAGGVNYFSSNSGFTVAQTGTLAINDFNQSLKSLSNSGIVDLGSNAGTTLTVTGDYTGNDGTVRIGTVLGDDNSVTDRLVVNGNANGTGILAVKNVGGSGAQTNEGIKIVDIAGTSNATFTLLGDYEFQGAPAVVGGAYAYQLYKSGKTNPSDGDWYLRSTIKEPDDGGGTKGGGEIPLYQPGVPSYEAYPQLLLGLNGLTTLQQRVGNRYWSNAGNIMLAEGADPVGSPYARAEEAGNLVEGNGVWGRIEGAHTKADPRFSTSGTDYSFNTLKLQAGLDGMLAETENGKLIGGITVHYTHGKVKTRSLYGDGEISTDGYGFGGTLTWYGDNGFYLDGQAQVTWYDSDLMSELANMGLADGNNGFGYAFSAESGKRIAIDQSWSVTPQAQLTYSNVDFDSFNDAFGARISLDRGESLQGRIGLAIEQQNSWYNANGLIDRTHLYGIANVYYEFLDGTKVDVSGTSFASKNERLWGGIGLGGSYNWNGDKYSIYGEGSVNTSLESFADSYTYKGTLGFRVRF